MLRRGACLVSRLAASGPHVAAAAESGGWAAGAPPAAAALQLLDRWQHHGSSGQGSGPYHMTVRNLSIWPGSGKQEAEQQQQQQVDSVAAAAEDLDAFDGGSSGLAAAADGSSTDAAAAAVMGTTSDLFSPASIVAAAAGAEADALASASESAWVGSRVVQSLLTFVRDTTGLTWWQSIMLTTLGMRIATLPIMIGQVKNTYRLSQARPEIEELVAHMKEEQARGNMQAAQEHQQRVMAVWAKYNCNPVKSLAGMFVQAPIFIGFFSALRALSAHKLPSLAEGGALWFTDLTMADPTYALPALAGLSFLLTIELGAADGMEGQPEESRKKLKNVMRGVALLVPLVSYDLPASVFMYWTASNIFSLVQSAVLKVPAVKRVVGLPDLSKLRTATAAAAKPGEMAGRPLATFTQKPRPASGSKK